MERLSITLGGHRLDLACDPQDAPRVRALAARLDEKIAAFRDALGAVGEYRLLALSALVLLDEDGSVKDPAKRIPLEGARKHA